MQVEVLQENLVKGLGAVSRFVAVKSSLPVLSMVLLKAKKGKLVLTGTDMDTGVELGVGAKIVKDGGVVVPARIVYEYVNTLPGGKVKLEAEKGVLRLVCGSSRAKITGMEESEFPDMPSFSDKKKVLMGASELADLVRLVVFAALGDSSRPVLSALLFKFRGSGKVDVIATDGYRMSIRSKIKIKGDAGVMKLLVSSSVLSELDRLMGEEGVSGVEMVFDDEKKSIAFSFGNVLMVTKLVEGEFPAYKKILPEGGDLVIKADKDEMLEAVKTAAIFARESSNIVRWKIQRGELRMSSNSVNVGEQESRVQVEMVKGDEGEIAFNSRFLIDLLGSLSVGKVEFSMNGSLRPGLFKAEEKDFVHVIMPVRVQGSSEKG